MPERTTAGTLRLALETSTTLGSVAVGRGEALLAEVLLGVSVRHSEVLLPAVEFALARAGVAAGDLQAIVVGAGPGSFTGVRIAAATAKGLAHALDISLLPYSSLAALAAGCAQPARPVCALFDARRGEVYGACYRFLAGGAWITVLPPTAGTADAIMDRVAGEDPLYTGDGALRNADRIRGRGGVVAEAPMALPRASALLWLAEQATPPLPVPVARWQPDYLRSSGARPAAS